MPRSLHVKYTNEQSLYEWSGNCINDVIVSVFTQSPGDRGINAVMVSVLTQSAGDRGINAVMVSVLTQSAGDRGINAVMVRVREIVASML